MSDDLPVMNALPTGDLAANSSALPVVAADLRVDLLRSIETAAPVTRATPWMSWALRSTNPEAVQRAYELRLAETVDELETPQWTTGKLISHDSGVSIPDGLLLPNREYFWSVRLWNGTDKAGPWAEPVTFRTASTLARDGYPPRPIPVRTAVAPVVIVEKEIGHVFLDFGRAAFATLRFRVPRASGGGTVNVHFGEKTDGPATVDRTPGGSILYLAVQATITEDGEWTEVTIPRRPSPNVAKMPLHIGEVAPFRYVEIEGLPGTVEKRDFEQLAVHTPWDDDAASFRSSDEILNQVWELCKYSIKATTFAAIYVDGDRERLPYEADAYINQLAHYGCEPSYALARFSHEWLLDHPTWPTEWRSHSVLMAWEDWLYTGDASSLARSYDRLKDKLFPGAAREDELISPPTEDIVDWPRGERDEYVFVKFNTVVNAFQFAALRHMANIARVLDKVADAVDFDQRADALFVSFNTVFWDDSNRRYVDGEGATHSSQHANLFPLALGLVPEDRLEDVRDFVESRNLACSVYAAHYLLEGLFANGGADKAVDLMRLTETRSWYNMIRAGSTITMEAWDKSFKGNLDWNHAWGAAPAASIPRWLLGVRPATPGWAEIIVSPNPGKLNWIEGKVPTLRGGVDIRLVKEGDTELTGQISVPSGCHLWLDLPLPLCARGDLFLNGEQVSATRAKNRICCTEKLPAGDYSFTVR